MTSKITLYYSAVLSPEKNYALDLAGSKGIEYYLETLESTEIESFQYVKHGLVISIKINKTQDELRMPLSDDLNYCRIVNGKESPIYYFITKLEWKSQNTIELKLMMDTLNSFEYNTDYTINAKTFIKRQHKDRFAFKVMKFKISEAEITPLLGAYQYVFDVPLHEPFEDIIEVTYKNASLPLIPAWMHKATFTYTKQMMAVQNIWRVTINMTGLPMGTLKIYVYASYKGLIRKIDLLSENLDAPKYKNQEEYPIVNKSDIKWYLLYRNKDFLSDNVEADLNSPIECFLIPSESIVVNGGATDSFPVTTSNIEIGYNSFLPEYYENYIDVVLEAGGNTYRPRIVQSRAPSAGLRQTKIYFACIYNTGSATHFYWYEYILTYQSGTTLAQMNLLETINNASVVIKTSAAAVPYFSEGVAPSNAWKDIYASDYPAPNQSFTTGLSNITLNNIDSVDRTDNRNVKLIALPYCPSSFNISAGVYQFDSNWTYDTGTGFLKYSDITHDFRNDIEEQSFNPYKVLYPYYDNKYNARLNYKSLRDDYNESKLYHSDYYLPKLVYDSFSYGFYLERYDFTLYSTQIYEEDYPAVNLKFIMTRTINSKFAFIINADFVKYATEDYPDVLTISRNNEEPLYNSAYINYIRSGYNYDKKTLERSLNATKLGIGMSGMTALISLFSGLLTGNPVLAGIGMATAGISLSSQFVNLFKNTAEGEQSLERKLNETARQAVSVSGSDDIDLLNAYANNQAKYVIYETSDRLKAVLGDLFHYCGYRIDQQGVPNVSSRYWFNYVEADIVIDYTNNLNEDIINDLTERFKNGVTFFHYNSPSVSFPTIFDFNQQYENAETWLS